MLSVAIVKVAAKERIVWAAQQSLTDMMEAAAIFGLVFVTNVEKKL